MSIMKIAAIGAVASLLVAGTAQAASTRADSAAPVAAIASKKLVRSSAPVAKQARDADAAVLAIAAAGAFGAGVYFVAQKNGPNPTLSTGS